MKTILLAGIAIVFAASPTLAADKKSPVWYTYRPSDHACVHTMTPPQMIAQIRKEFHQEPDINDYETDEDGKPTATRMVIHDPINSRLDIEFFMFRDKTLCDNFVQGEKMRTDTSRYE